MTRADRLAAASARRMERWAGVVILVAIIVALAIASHGELPDERVLVPVELVTNTRR